MLIPALYFVLGDENTMTDAAASGAAFLGLVLVNFVLGWLRPSTVVSPRYAISFALLQLALLTATWWLSEQTSVEVLTGAAAFLWLAVVGLSLGELAAVTLAMIAVYLVLI